MDEFACHQRSLELACTDMFRQKGTLNEEHALAMSPCTFCLSIRETGGVPSRACCSNDLEPGAAVSTRIQSWQLNSKKLCAVLEKGQNIRNVLLLPTRGNQRNSTRCNKSTAARVPRGSIPSAALQVRARRVIWV